MLARDLNGNGLIDNITELFGSNSIDGFTALRELDVNHDNKITSANSGFSSLRVWTDVDGDSVTDTSKLQSLANLSITTINLNATAVNQTVNGNIIAEVATFVRGDGSTGQVGEAFFDNSRLNSHSPGITSSTPPCCCCRTCAATGRCRISISR